MQECFFSTQTQVVRNTTSAAARGIPHMQYLNKKLTLMLLALKIQQLDHHYGLGST